MVHNWTHSEIFGQRLTSNGNFSEREWNLIVANPNPQRLEQKTD